MAFYMDYILVKNSETTTVEQEWGRLLWYANTALGQPDYTLGLCYIKPGHKNYTHAHPNCMETLHVLKGEILHRAGSESVKMDAGDSISIPAGVVHCAENIGRDTAEMAIAFSSGNRETIEIY
jgi:quercetin dioxygenase-like cupin family protein